MRSVFRKIDRVLYVVLFFLSIVGWLYARWGKGLEPTSFEVAAFGMGLAATCKAESKEGE